MEGLVSKKHVLLVAKEFGWRKALKLLMSKEPVALLVLMA